MLCKGDFMCECAVLYKRHISTCVYITTLTLNYIILRSCEGLKTKYANKLSKPYSTAN